MSVDERTRRWHEIIDTGAASEEERARLHAALDEGVRRVRDLARAVKVFEYAFFNPPNGEVERVEGAQRAFERLRAANDDVEEMLNG